MDTVLAWILPEFFITSLGISRRRLALILGGTVAFAAVVGVVCMMLLSKEEQTARDSATRFASALVNDNPAAAPPGAGDYVGGVRHYYGEVTSAKVIGAHNKGVNTGDNADTRAFFVVEMLLHTRRGPAVIELEYDNHALLSQKVSRIYELEPNKAPGVSRAEQNRLEAALKARGGEPANADDLSLQATPAVPHVQVTAPAMAKPAKPAIPAKLRCIQAAHGDVQKMQKCA